MENKYLYTISHFFSRNFFNSSNEIKEISWQEVTTRFPKAAETQKITNYSEYLEASAPGETFSEFLNHYNTYLTWQIHTKYPNLLFLDYNDSFGGCCEVFLPNGQSVDF